MGVLRSRMIGFGASVPDRVLSNHDLEKMVKTSDDWIFSRSGIRERRIAEEGVVTSDLGAQASERALEAAGMKASDLDMIVVGTATPDMPLPSTACHIQRKIGATGAAAFDVEAGCSGYLYALATGDAFIRSGKARRVLLVGVELLSRVVNWKDRTTCILFGDGAGASVLVAEEGDRGVLSTHLYSDGNGWDLIAIPGGGTKHPQGEKTLQENLQYIQMQGKETFKVAVKSIVESCVDALKFNNVTVEDIDHVISHQANARIIQAVVSRLKVDDEKVHINLDRYGILRRQAFP